MATTEEIQTAVDRTKLWSQYFEQAPPPSEMMEESFPIPDVGVSSAQWPVFALPAGSGILDRGGEPFWLRNLNNASNQATFTTSTTTKTAEAVVAGFYYKLNRDIVVDLPGVDRATTYHIGLEYDPARELSPAGPIRQVVRTSIDDTGGKVYIPCWEVTRQANQLLTQARVVQKRPKIAPTLTADTRDQLPRLKGLLWGTRIILTSGVDAGKEVIASGSSTDTGSPTRFDSLTNPPWKPLSLASSYRAGRADQRPEWRIVQGDFQTQGVVKRDGDKLLTKGGETRFAYVSGLDMAPQRFFPAAGTGGRGIRVSTGPGDTVFDTLYYYTDEQAAWLDLSTVRFELKS